MRPRETLIAPGELTTELLFVEAGMASVVVHLENGQAVEAAAVGYEGVLGAEAVTGGAPMPSVEVLGQVEGEVAVLPVTRVREVLAACPTLQARLHQFQALSLSVALQSVACASQHVVDDRLARWLLTVADRTGSESFQLTQEFMAQMLGVQRSSVTLAARAFALEGIIEYRRGHVRIADRDALEEAACECYEVIAAQYRRLVAP